MEITYRKPHFEDLGRLAEIHNHAFREMFDTAEKSPDYFRSFIPGDNLHHMLVAEIEGEVVAYAGTYPFLQRKAYSQLAEILVYVYPEWRRRRFGSALLGEIHKNDFLGGLHTVLVLITKDNIYLASGD
jgi:L-amino acid N-acyltransferase YncA